MKQLKPTAFVVGFLTLIIWAASASTAHAQEPASRVVDVGYIGGNLTRTIEFPIAPGPNLGHGNTYVVNGIDIKATVNVTEAATIIGRYQRKALSNAQNFTDVQIGDIRGRHSEPDTTANGQQMDYVEVAGSLKLPKTHGHSLLIGIARTTTERHWRYEDVFGGVYGGEDRDKYLGLVFGIVGTQKLRTLTFDYGVRSYYHLMLQENDATNKLPASGYELGGSVTWTIQKHLGVKGGYEFRRLHTEVGTQPYNSTENVDDHGPVIGIRLSF